MGEQKKKQVPSVWEDLFHLLIKILSILLMIVLLFTFLFGITRYNNLSMDPYVRDGDVVIYYRLDKRYVATDLVAVKYKDKVHVLRVVAKEGDTVDIKGDGLYINGYRQEEPDKTQVTLPYEGGVDFPITLKSGEIFLLGDNRENATDSRIFGAVKASDTLGEIMTIARRRNF